MSRRCESCGRFVPKGHLRTARYFYNIDRTKPIHVYSLATSSVFQERLDCADCSMECCRMREAKREHGVAVGRSLPEGWIKCAPGSTQDNLIVAVLS